MNRIAATIAAAAIATTLTACGGSSTPKKAEAPAAQTQKAEAPKSVKDLVKDTGCTGEITTGKDVVDLAGSWAAQGEAAHCAQDDFKGIVIVKAKDAGSAMNLATAARESGDGWKLARSSGQYVCAPFGPGGGISCPKFP